MSTDSIPSRSNAQTIDQTWFNVLAQVLEGDHVPRNLSGVATSLAGALGSATYMWNWLYAKALSIGGVGSSNLISMQSPSGLAAPYTLTLPTGLPSSGTYVLTLDNTGQVAVTALDSSHLVPAGGLLSFAGSVIPTGWLLCDGSAVSRATYAALFAVLSTTWGSGNGSTTFNLPDLRSRVPVGAGTGTGLSNWPLASTGGEETHGLVAGEMPVHSHSITDPGHNHTWLAAAISSGSFPYFSSPLGTTQIGDSGLIRPATTGITGTNNSGGGNPHNNIQPSVAVNWIVKT